MADATSSQIYDGARNLSVKLTNVSDGTGQTAAKVVDVTTLTPNPGTHLKLRRIKYSIESMSVRLQWEGTPNQDLVLISNGENILDFSKEYAGGIPNNAASPTGNVLLTTIGAAANSNYVIDMEFIKGV